MHYTLIVNGRSRCIAEVQVGEVGGSDQTVCDTKGTEDTYQIVGIDEANVQERRTI
jgi:transcription elongation GreA/GreB family factor